MLRLLTAGSACALSACTVCLPCVRHSQNKFKLEMNKENFKGFFSARYVIHIIERLQFFVVKNQRLFGSFYSKYITLSLKKS